MITFALIDKHAIQRTGLGLLLEKEFSKAGILHFDSVATLTDLHSDIDTKVAILSANHYPHSRILTHIRITKQAFPNAKIVLFDEDVDSATTNFTMVWHFLGAGANGYVTRLDNVSGLLTCVQDVMIGKRYISNYAFAATQDVLTGMAANKRRTKDLLSTRETEIVGYLLEGMSTKFIANKLERKASTISTIKNSVYKKLGVDNIVELKEVFDRLVLSEMG